MRRRGDADLGCGPVRVHRASVSTFVLVSRKASTAPCRWKRVNRPRLGLHYFCLKLQCSNGESGKGGELAKVLAGKHQALVAAGQMSSRPEMGGASLQQRGRDIS
jgi:hypothetical protein